MFAPQEGKILEKIIKSLDNPDEALSFVISLQEIILKMDISLIDEWKKNIIALYTAHIRILKKNKKYQDEIFDDYQKIMLLKNLIDFLIAVKKKTQPVVSKTQVQDTFVEFLKTKNLQRANQLFIFAENIAQLNEHKNPWFDWFFLKRNTTSWVNTITRIRKDALLKLQAEENKITDIDEKISFLKQAKLMPIFNSHETNSLFKRMISNTDAVIQINNRIKALEQEKRNKPQEIEKKLENNTIINYVGRYTASLGGIPFYRSTGENSKQEKTWFPFSGVHLKDGRYIKPKTLYFRDYGPSDLLRDKLDDCFPDLLATYLYNFHENRVNYSEIIYRLGNFEGMCFSMCIGGGFWDITAGKNLEEFLRENYGDSIKAIENQYQQEIAHLKNNGNLSGVEEITDFHTINGWLARQKDTRITFVEGKPEFDFNYSTIKSISQDQKRMLSS